MRYLKIWLILSLIITLMFPSKLMAGEELDRYMGRIEAGRAADREVNKNCWGCAGVTIVGVGIAMMWRSSSPDPAVFLGKSPEYIKAYTDAYNSRVKRIQTTYSCLGFMGTLTIVGCVFGIIEAYKETDESCRETSNNCNAANNCLYDCSTGSSGR
jgi:hypothetical protein